MSVIILRKAILHGNPAFEPPYCPDDPFGQWRNYYQENWDKNGPNYVYEVEEEDGLLDDNYDKYSIRCVPKCTKMGKTYGAHLIFVD